MSCCNFSVVIMWFIDNVVAMWLDRCCCVSGVEELLLLIAYDVADYV